MEGKPGPPSKIPTVIRANDDVHSPLPKTSGQRPTKAQREIEKLHSDQDERTRQSWYEDAMPLAMAQVIPEPEPEPRVSTIACDVYSFPVSYLTNRRHVKTMAALAETLNAHIWTILSRGATQLVLS